MVVTFTGNGDLDHGEISCAGVFVVTLLAGPTEDVECEIWIGLGL